VTKKPPELPNIEDATLRACLAPLMEAMNAGAEAVAVEPVHDRTGRSPPFPPGSNDNARSARDHSGTPGSLAEWRSLADDDFGAFRMIELFIAMTDTERETAAAEFPRQIGGTVARIARLKHRLAGQYDTVTTALALLERAVARTSGVGWPA
jgi:hypothetical protein